MAESPSTYFPDFRVQWGLRRTLRFLTEQLEYPSGRKVRRQVYPAGGYRHLATKSQWLIPADRQVLYDFFLARKGMLEAFWFFMPAPVTLVDYACGTVSGASTFIVPLKGPWYRGETAVAGTYTTVKVAGVSKAFTVTANIGAGGEDRITFTGGAQTGAVTVTGSLLRERITCQFEMDELSEEFLESYGPVNSAFDVQIGELF